MNMGWNVFVSSFYIWPTLNIRSLEGQGLGLCWSPLCPQHHLPGVWLRRGSQEFLLNEHPNKPMKRPLPAQIDLESLWAGRQTLLFYWKVTPWPG